ncbi:MAG: sigma-70 family polymerase sigma factor [Eubacterium sp.]|nr:sigma-70 family polymerase sigma factor [Eubacterium sp.]
MINEAKILANLREKKRGSLEKLIDIYTPYISVIVYNIIGRVMTNEDIEEVISDAFISLWKHADAIDSEKGSIRTYLGAIARNCAKNKLREVKTHAELDESIISEEIEPQEGLKLKEDKRLLLDLITQLGEPDSEIFMRYYYFEERIGKISQRTGLCTSTIKTKLVRGRTKLKEALVRERWESNE